MPGQSIIDHRRPCVGRLPDLEYSCVAVDDPVVGDIVSLK
jgi:hypothetical protein